MDEEADLTELLEEQHTLSRALSELLSRIEERLQHDGSGLTEEERSALSELLPQVANQQLRQALEALLEEEDQKALEKRVGQAQALAQAQALPEEGPSNGTRKEALPPAPEGEEDRTLTWKAPEASDEAADTKGARQSSSTAESQSSSSEEDRLAGGDDEDRFGGVEGEAGEPEPTAHAPGFIPTELIGAIGSQGGFQELLTKGVPLEQNPDPEKEAGHFSVDYETLRALLEGRAIPTEAQEMVRMYFKMITQQGGP